MIRKTHLDWRIRSAAQRHQFSAGHRDEGTNVDCWHPPDSSGSYAWGWADLGLSFQQLPKVVLQRGIAVHWVDREPDVVILEQLLQLGDALDTVACRAIARGATHRQHLARAEGVGVHRDEKHDLRIGGARLRLDLVIELIKLFLVK